MNLLLALAAFTVFAVAHHLLVRRAPAPSLSIPDAVPVPVAPPAIADPVWVAGYELPEGLQSFTILEIHYEEN